MLVCHQSGGLWLVGPSVCLLGGNYTRRLLVVVPRESREGLIVNLFKKGDPGIYRDITLLSVVGKVFCKNT